MFCKNNLKSKLIIIQLLKMLYWLRFFFSNINDVSDDVLESIIAYTSMGNHQVFTKEIYDNNRYTHQRYQTKPSDFIFTGMMIKEIKLEKITSIRQNITIWYEAPFEHWYISFVTFIMMFFSSCVECLLPSYWKKIKFNGFCWVYILAYINDPGGS